jgi:hypothetical protein
LAKLEAFLFMNLACELDIGFWMTVDKRRRQLMILEIEDDNCSSSVDSDGGRSWNCDSSPARLGSDVVSSSSSEEVESSSHGILSPVMIANASTN